VPEATELITNANPFRRRELADNEVSGDHYISWCRPGPTTWPRDFVVGPTKRRRPAWWRAGNRGPPRLEARL